MSLSILISNIKTLRLKNNLSQAELGRALGLPVKQSMCKNTGHWETGYSKPQLYHIALLSLLFDISIDDLCRKELDKKNNIYH